mmetsp:Transcript_17296/g.35324  ORF Transcript_17296/g.35324 Transcript_17296/m.35324 type:complete len:342 (+) Transcript_17296:2-1027(+)
MKSAFSQMGFREDANDGSGGVGDKAGGEGVGNSNRVPLGERRGGRASGSAAAAGQVEEVKVEWWDALILKEGAYGGEAALLDAKVTSYVEHPVPIQPPKDDPEPAPQPLKLTKKERKKMRTLRRKAKEQEKQELIKQGLMEPPKPRVKMSNLVRVLADAEKLGQDPTKIEKEVKAQMAARLQEHEDRNLANKLTPAERREKKMRKMFDPQNGLFMAVFKVGSLKNPQHKYKVNVNATENMLTGCVLTGDSFSLVVVEGCSKSIVRYKKLMLRRIQWDAWIAGEEPPPGAGVEGNACALLWEGSIIEPHFTKFRQEVEKTDDSARKYLGDFGCAHLWDLATA